MRRSKKTSYAETTTMIKLARNLNKKSFRNATKKDMQSFFAKPDLTNSGRTRDTYGTQIIKFFNWLFDLKRKERPDNMVWFEHQTAKEKERSTNPNKKEEQFLTREEYDRLISGSHDLQDKALWEIFYLSGARPGEIHSMAINGITELPNGYEITVLESKTKPRKIPLSETPIHLLRWIQDHPFKDKPDYPLWLSHSSQNYKQPMKISGIGERLKISLKRCNIKETITPHCFRRTRATIMFGEGYTDKEMGLHFGWKLRSVPLRREEYDLTNHEDLRKKVFAKSKKPLSYETLKKQKDKLEKDLRKEITDLKTDLEKKAKIDNFIIESLSVIAKETMQTQGVEAIKEIFRKHNIPLVGD